MDRRLFLTAGAAALVAAPRDGWCPEPGMGRNNDHNQDTFGGRSGPGSEAGSNNNSERQQRESCRVKRRVTSKQTE